MPRLFVALPLPETVRAELAARAEPLAGAAWAPADNLHLTLRFIGEVSEARGEELAEALATVHVEPFILSPTGMGAFPTRGPARVVWAGFGTAHPRLFQLRKRVDDALLRVESGLDVSTFHPHVTLARLGREYDPRELARYLARQSESEGAPFRVNEFHLMASELQPGVAPRYRSVRRFALGE